MHVLTCPHCSNEHNLTDDRFLNVAGKNAKCGKCGSRFPVPMPEYQRMTAKQQIVDRHRSRIVT
jgi:predicted Zn finger-like uncharacterized protein